MTFNRMPPDALNHVVLGAGVIFSGDFPSIFELQDNADDSSILGATSGGVSVDLTPKITTFSGDGNSRQDANYIRYDAWTAKLSCKLVTLSRALFEYALSGTESAAAVSQLEVIPQWCGVNYCYGGWQLVDVEDETESAEEEADSERVKSVAETETLLSEIDENALENKVLIETDRTPITWEDIPWQILRDLRLSVIRGGDTVVGFSEEWKVAVAGNSTLGIEVNAPEDSVIQNAYTEISIGEGRYRFKPHTHTRLTLQAETGSVLMNEHTTHTYTASILPAWGYTLNDEEAGAEQLTEEKDDSKTPKEQYVWQILTYTGDPIDLEEVEGSKEPNEEEEEEAEEAQGEEEEEEEEEEPEEEEDGDKDENKEQEQIAFTCGQTVTVRAMNPGTVVLRCTATRLDARESSDLIITVVPVAILYVKANSTAEASLVDTDDSSYVPFMVKDDTNGAGTLVFAKEAEAEDEEDDDSQVLEFVTGGDSDGGGGDNNSESHSYFIVGSTSDAQSDVEETTKKLAEKYTGQMASARQQVAAAETLVDDDDDDSDDDEAGDEYDETLEALEEVKNTSGWGNVLAVGGGGVSTVAQDVWWVGNYGFESDGSKYAAIHLKNATLTSGLKISSNDAKLAEVSVTFESAYDTALEDALPFEVYLSGEDEDESPEPEEGAEE